MTQNDIPGKPSRGKPSRGRLVAIGMMSGTSMDGIDVALVTSDGEAEVERGPSGAYSYDPAFRKRLNAALETAKAIKARDERPGDLAELETEITMRHVAAVRAFLEANRLRPSDIDVIGFHGQTVLHRPDEGLTVQLGDGALLARETGITTVYDMRANDMTHGGQGAPLVPVWHRALAANLPEAMRALPVAFVNIGGIANITWVGKDVDPVAFDTGPGNALIDQWVSAHAGVPYDPEGAIAAEGGVLMPLAKRYLSHPYLEKPGPKSLDRLDFLPPDAVESSLEDGARTLAYVTAAAIWKAAEHLPEAPKLWVICGGGRHNRVIMNDLTELAEAAASPVGAGERSEPGARQKTAVGEDPAGRSGRPLGAGEQSEPGVRQKTVVTAEEAGFDGDAMEAEAWAYLAVRSLKGLTLTWPTTTGCREPVSGGVLAMP